MKHGLLWIIAAYCVLASSSCCCVVGLELKPTYLEHHFATIKHEPNAWILIDAVGKEEIEVESVRVDSTTTLFVAPPGRYKVRELLAKENAMVANQAYTEVVCQAEPTPAPKPEPKPQPDPNPKPQPDYPETPYGVGPKSAAAFRQSGIGQAELQQVISVFAVNSALIAEKRISGVQASVDKVKEELLKINQNTGGKLTTAYTTYAAAMVEASNKGKISDMLSYGKAYAEIAEWLRKG